MQPAELPASKDPILQPFAIRHVRFRNRVMSTSHASGLQEGGVPGEAYQAYHEEKAKGGIGLTMFGGSSNVDLDSPNIFRQLNVGTDAIIPHLQRFSERIHNHGARLMCQITHLGRRGDPYADEWLATIAPSAVRETLHRSIPKEMDEHDIDRVVRAYARAARRCKDGGLDGIETLASGHLLGQFLSSVTNRRTDRFGGSLEKRCRFVLMVHEAIRDAVGEDFLVGIRLPVDESSGDGLSFEECTRIALILKSAGTVDFFNAIYGTMDTTRGLAQDIMPGMGSPIAPWVEAVGAFRREVGLPVFHAARISDVSSARYAIAEGKLDMAGMTRAHIADPHLVEKLATGREAEIRPCVGATHCQSPYRPACLHNPATGRETRLKHVIAKADGPVRNVIVVGGGPAGLEAARVSAERGHKVELFEAASELGGQVLLGASSPWRKELRGIVDWRVAELERLQVAIHTNAYMEASDLREREPDVVIVATGGTPRIDIAEGAELCVSTWDILSGQARVGADVLVYDGTGRHPAPLVAERAMQVGARIRFATIDPTLAEELTYAERFNWKKRFIEMGIVPLTETRLVSVRREEGRLLASLVNDITRDMSQIAVDQVVVEQGSAPMDDIYSELRQEACNEGVTDLHAFTHALPQPRLKNSGFELHRIGDAVASRNIHAAILDALRICTPL